MALWSTNHALKSFGQIYNLSLACNIIGGQKGTQDQLQTLIERDLNRYLSLVNPDWRIVWGPTVWKGEKDSTTTGADLVWFVANNPSFRIKTPTTTTTSTGNDGGDNQVYNTYTIAVAGEAYFQAGSLVHMHVPSQSEGLSSSRSTSSLPASISLASRTLPSSTSDIVYTILSYPSPSSNTSLIEFMTMSKFTVPRPEKVIVTGHSLGEPITTSLALALGQDGTFNQLRPSNVAPDTAFLIRRNLAEYDEKWGKLVARLIGKRTRDRRFPVAPSLSVINRAIVHTPEPEPKPGMASMETNTQAVMSRCDNPIMTPEDVVAALDELGSYNNETNMDTQFDLDMLFLPFDTLGHNFQPLSLDGVDLDLFTN